MTGKLNNGLLLYSGHPMYILSQEPGLYIYMHVHIVIPVYDYIHIDRKIFRYSFRFLWHY